MKRLHTYLVVGLWSASFFIAGHCMCLGQNAPGQRSTIQGQIKDRNHGGPGDVQAATWRSSLTFDVMVHNVLQITVFAGGPFSPPEGGNRSLFFEALFNF
jgi:hypothetical protein